MIIILRGHVRDSLKSDDLYNFLRELHAISPLQLYVHTWGVKQNSLSWRRIPSDASMITDATITAYLRDLAPCVRSLKIDPDGSLPLVGSTEGRLLPVGNMPKRGWKNMWAGMYAASTSVRENHADDELVLNTRFDVLANSNNFGRTQLIDFYKRTLSTKPANIVFLRNELFNGCDNYFVGPVARMHALITAFHLTLDDVLAAHPLNGNHEKYVMLEARRVA